MRSDQGLQIFRPTRRPRCDDCGMSNCMGAHQPVVSLNAGLCPSYRRIMPPNAGKRLFSRLEGGSFEPPRP
jgi:hypothetical protein